jgi:hypothetical protein
LPSLRWTFRLRKQLANYLSDLGPVADTQEKSFAVRNHLPAC